jgi:pilus assembly protein TadC
MTGPFIVFLWLVGMVLLANGVQRLLTRQRARERVFAAVDAEVPAPSEEDLGPLARWLFVAGYRSPRAPTVFLIAAISLALFGLLLSITLSSSGLLRTLEKGLERFPGNIGQVFLPFVYAGPWLAGIIFGSLPWLTVRRARRRRVTQIEQDLPLFLELLATLGEAGLGFDAALARILDAQPGERPLTQELRTFQVEVLAGRPRVQVLRRLSRRVDVTTFTVFISALVQAEQSGAGVAGVLRRQAEDARDRRRERTLQLAAALPVKLLFPLIICFLPGIFVAALGPTAWQFFQFVDSLTRGARGGP